jgi:release factor glutamine methyltransferase
MTDIQYLKKYYKGNIEDAIKRLNNGEPVQYIVGDVDFYGNVIKVDKRVLIPRFETEGLVELALKYLNNTNLDVVDIGTGSGCIAITLKKKLPNINMDAVDISKDALSLAIENAELNDVNINFYNGDMLKPLDKKYDCIISNPPYIAYDEEVMEIVKNNEPNNALYADNNGLYFYEEILKNCKNYLKDKYYIFFEIGYSQGNSIKEIALKYLDCEVEIKKDLQGFDRYVIINNKEN